ALSDFRRTKLLSRCRELAPAAASIHAEFVHFLDTSAQLSATEQKELDGLLQYGPQIAGGARTGSLLLVVPRPGTISPWSSKATDILHNCGITHVRRIERGVAY